MSQPSLRATAVAMEIERVMLQPNKGYGAVLLEGVSLANFLEASEVLERRGFAFSTCGTWPEAEQALVQGVVHEDTAVMGNIFMSADPSGAHSSASDTFTFLVLLQLHRVGLGDLFLAAGDRFCSLGTAGGQPQLEPDAALDYLPARERGRSAPTLVLEVAVSQSSRSLAQKLQLWVRPQAQGGAGAELAVGLDIKGPQQSAFILLPGVLTGSVVDFGQGSGCSRKGEPRFFLWLPLAQLMPGSWWLGRGVASLRIAACGLWDGLAAFLAMPPWRALRCAWQRLHSPWAALPVDMYPLKFAISKYQ